MTGAIEYTRRLNNVGNNATDSAKVRTQNPINAMSQIFTTYRFGGQTCNALLEQRNNH
jgi:hypothetical protein